VGKNINELSDTHRGNVDQVIEEAAESLHQFTVTIRSLNKTVADPEAQENLRTTLAALPKMVDETRQTIQSVRSAVVKADAALGNLSEVTEPLAKRSHSIATRLDNSIASLETVMAEMAIFTRTINSENGSLSLLAKDPQLYRNLDQASSALALIMKNLGPMMEDLRIFSDKIARHPELLGVSGVIEPSTGIKNADDVDRRTKKR
jgi:phospholipid/cholesterol/gamma-HCH transport system substrate-binding protein